MTMFLSNLGQCSLFLACAAIVAIALLRFLRLKSYHIHAWAWWLVLANGVVLASFSVAIPWYSASQEPNGASTRQQVSATAQHPLVVDGLGKQSIPYATDSQTNFETEERNWNWPLVLATVWAGGMVFFVARWLIDSVRFHQACHSQAGDNPRWRAQWDAMLSENGIKRRIPMYVTPDVGPLLCCTITGYRLVVPQCLFDTMTHQQRECVFRHELTHFKRFDVWRSLAAHLLALPHWFNPLAWLAVRKLEESSEWACDAASTTEDEESQPNYARVLLAICERAGRRRAWGQAMSGGSLSRRISRIIASEDARDSRGGQSFIAAVMLAFVFVQAVRIELVAREPRETNSQFAVIQQGAVGDSAPDVESTDDKAPLRVTGRVVDPEDRPVGDAFVTIRAYYPAESSLRSYETRSAEDGSFALEFPSDFSETNSLHLWGYAEGHGIRTVLLRILLGDDKLIGGVKISLPPTDSATYQVLLPDGEPCADALVHPRYVEVPNGVYQADLPTGLRTFLPENLAQKIARRTDADGRVSFDAIPKPLRASVLVKAAGFGAQEFESPADELQLAEAASVFGEIVADDPSQYAGTRVHLTTRETSQERFVPRVRSGIADAEVGQDGKFQVPEIAAGGLERIGVFGWPSESNTLPYTSDESLVISPGETRRLKIEARPTIPIKGRLITSDTRQPVVNAKVSIKNMKSADRSQYVRTDASGWFEGRVMSGTVYVQVTVLDDSLQRKYDYPRIPQFEVPEDVESFELGDILVAPQELVSGTLLDADGRPASNVKLGLHTGAFRLMAGTATTAEDGTFEIRLRDRTFLPPEQTKWVLIGEPASPMESPQFTTLDVESEEPLVLKRRDERR